MHGHGKLADSPPGNGLRPPSGSATFPQPGLRLETASGSHIAPLPVISSRVTHTIQRGGDKWRETCPRNRRLRRRQGCARPGRSIGVEGGRPQPPHHPSGHRPRSLQPRARRKRPGLSSPGPPLGDVRPAKKDATNLESKIKRQASLVLDEQGLSRKMPVIPPGLRIARACSMAWSLSPIAGCKIYTTLIP
jgi:hypothetical protein